MGARRLFKQVLEARRRLVGVKHPHTTVTAWNLFCLLQAVRWGAG